MLANQNLPRQAGLKITTIDGKRCTGVRRANAQPETTQVRQTTPPAQTTAAPVRQTQPPPSSDPPPPPPPPPVVTSTSQPASLSSPAVAEPTAQPPTTSDPPEPVSSSSPPIALPEEESSTSEETSALVSTPNPILSFTTPEAISESTSTPIIRTETRPFPTESAGGGSNTGNTNNGIGSENNEVLPLPTSSLLESAPNNTQGPAPEISNGEGGGVATVPSSNSNLGAIIGGVIGGIFLIAILVAILFFCRRRRRKQKDTFPSPPSTGTREKFYEIDNGSVGPTRRSTKLKQTIAYRLENVSESLRLVGAGIAGIGSLIKSKVSGERNGTPTVNLDRGNSQFFHGPVPQHSRNNSSVIMSTHTGQSSVKDKFQDWWGRFTDVWRQKQPDEGMVGPFAASRSMSEKGANNAVPTFSQLVAYDDQEAQKSHRRNTSSLGSFANPTIPKLDNDPFADPYPDPFADPEKGPQAQPQPWLPPKAMTTNDTTTAKSNPFADPIVPIPPAPSVSKPQTYVQSVRQSRANSSSQANTQINTSETRASAYRPPSGTSRYPSTIAPSITSDRDTVGSFSGVRKGKGRSDPFDLERPFLWRKKEERSGPPLSHQTQSHSANGNLKGATDSLTSLDQTAGIMNNIINSNRGPNNERDSTDMYPEPLRTGDLRTAGHVRYSSGVASISDWGGPGPDLGSNHQSMSSSLHGNASSRSYTPDISLAKQNSSGNDSGKGGLLEVKDRDDDGPKISMDEPRPYGSEWELQRRINNASPVSALSFEGVGRAS